jgi:hypothetical protein
VHRTLLGRFSFCLRNVRHRYFVQIPKIVSGKISRPLRRLGIGSKQRSLPARPSAPTDSTCSASATGKQSFVLLGHTKYMTMPFDSVIYPFYCKRLNLGVLFSAKVNPAFLQQRIISSEMMKNIIKSSFNCHLIVEIVPAKKHRRSPWEATKAFEERAKRGRFRKRKIVREGTGATSPPMFPPCPAVP